MNRITSPHRRLTAAAAATAALAITGGMLVGPGNAAAGEAPVNPDIAYQDLNWEACPEIAKAVETASCATFKVPKNYQDPAGETIDVMMSRIPATGESKGVIAGNPGGPGGDALGFMSELNLPDDVRDSYDLVGVQPRGLEFSTPLTCDSGQDDAVDDAPMISSVIDVFAMNAGDLKAQCEQAQPGYVETITTENTARDLDFARKLLGQEKLNLIGISYGGPLMANYATLFPEHTGKVILDSSVHPDQRWFGIADATNETKRDALDAFFAWTAERDDEYHLGTTPLQVYQSWSRRVAEEAGTTPQASPPAAEAADLPAGSSGLGQAGLDALDALNHALWRSSTFREAADDWVGLATSSEETLTGSMSEGVVLSAVTRTDSAWPDAATLLSTGSLPDDGEPAEEPTEEELHEILQAQIYSGYVFTAITCNENAVPPNTAGLLPLYIAMFTGGEALYIPEDQLGTGYACEGWPTTSPAIPVNSAALETAPLNLGMSDDTRVGRDGAPGMARAMGGELLIDEGYDHAVLGRENPVFLDEISAYFR